MPRLAALRRTRLIKRRERFVSKTGLKHLEGSLFKQIGKAEANLKGAKLDCCSLSELFANPDSGYKDMIAVSLHIGSSEFGNAAIQARLKKDPQRKLSLEIENLQGMPGDAHALSKFKDENGIVWNAYLTNVLTSAAYHSGFDRVLLRDITTTYDYQHPFVIVGHTKMRQSEGPLAEKARKNMKQLYTRTAKECGFTKREGNYWVREFP
ncbi:MAG: hypothetical protein HY544_03680 [Candidatus Diapherotrites archaeon]|uniref:Uncharacterized protein n=1 Tax=Candidatus Iainarchaeum sp. TaxID=3101447 RepID=A0A8T3YLN4_9ARCH|nr:hypothetical protein [Candidatus Diapherotrites archaeon]